MEESSASVAFVSAGAFRPLPSTYVVPRKLLRAATRRMSTCQQRAHRNINSASLAWTRSARSQKVFQPGTSGQLRDLSIIPKRIRQPKNVAPFPKPGLKEALSIYKLSHKRLSGGHVRIALDPRSTDRLEGPFVRVVLHFFEQARIERLEPGHLLSGGCGEAVLREAVH